MYYARNQYGYYINGAPLTPEFKNQNPRFGQFKIHTHLSNKFECVEELIKVMRHRGYSGYIMKLGGDCPNGHDKSVIYYSHISNTIRKNKESLYWYE